MTRPALTSFLMAFQLVLSSAGSAVANHSSSALLPDLAMLQPNEFHLEVSGGVRRLRFSTYIVNLGPGRFDVYGSDPDPADANRLTRVTQRLQQDGTWVTHASPATMFYAGDGHNHWHVHGLQAWSLAFQAAPNNTIATGAKTGFCFWDNVNLSNAPLYYDGTDECHQQLDGTVPMGLSVNWGDKYPWSIAFQYIDITAFPVGNYCLTLTADPRGEFIEASTANNTVQTLIAIGTSSVSVLAQDCASNPSSGAPTALTATAVRQGTLKVKLAWTGGASSIDVYRQKPAGALVRIATTTNSGSYRDNLGKRPVSGTYIYAVCNAGTTLCSGDATVSVP
jgi:hypothetical protein